VNDFELTSACTPFGLLACKIVEQAILDYRALTSGRSLNSQTSIEEILHFLKSQWCDDLLGFTELNGNWVLWMLEHEKPMKKEQAGLKYAKRPVTIGDRTAPLGTWCNELGISQTTGYRMYKKYGREYVESWFAAIKTARGL
jgi:hypothetical protein